MGFAGSGKQRYQCLVCRNTFTREVRRIRMSDTELLGKYLIDGWTLKQFGNALGCSPRLVQKRIHGILGSRPPVMEVPAATVLVVDATWNRRQWCLLIYRDAAGLILAHRFGRGENFEAYAEDLHHLKTNQYFPYAIVCDGHPALLKAVRTVFPEAIQQRCLVHVQRQALIWLTQNPKTEAGRELRVLSSQLLQVKASADAKRWNQEMSHWHTRFQQVLMERTQNIDQATGEIRSWWYTHRSLRKTWRLLKNAQPNLWHWLENSTIPKTSNLLEGGINAPIKRLIQRHTGLAPDRQKSAIEWWIHLRNLRQKINTKML